MELCNFLPHPFLSSQELPLPTLAQVTTDLLRLYNLPFLDISSLWNPTAWHLVGLASFPKHNVSDA